MFAACTVTGYMCGKHWWAMRPNEICVKQSVNLN